MQFSRVSSLLHHPPTPHFLPPPPPTPILDRPHYYVSQFLSLCKTTPAILFATLHTPLCRPSPPPPSIDSSIVSFSPHHSYRSPHPRHTVSPPPPDPFLMNERHELRCLHCSSSSSGLPLLFTYFLLLPLFPCFFLLTFRRLPRKSRPYVNESHFHQPAIPTHSPHQPLQEDPSLMTGSPNVRFGFCFYTLAHCFLTLLAPAPSDPPSPTDPP